MAPPKPKQVRAVVHPNPPIPMHIAYSKLQKQYTSKCDELERAQKAIQILQEKLHRCQERRK